jgi:hypothetical protein
LRDELKASCNSYAVVDKDGSHLSAEPTEKLDQGWSRASGLPQVLADERQSCKFSRFCVKTYLLNSSVRKMVAQLYGERGQSTQEYYFWDDRLFFVFQIESRYDKPLSGRVVERKEARFYFSDGALIRWLAGMTEIPASSSEQSSADASCSIEQ